jgi:hypothetical protein
MGAPATILLGVIIRGNADVKEIESGLAAGQLGQFERDERIRSLGPVPGALLSPGVNHEGTKAPSKGESDGFALVLLSVFESWW